MHHGQDLQGAPVSQGGGMSRLLTITSAWVLLAIPLAIVAGRALRLADTRAGRQLFPRSAPPVCRMGAVPRPGPTTRRTSLSRRSNRGVMSRMRPLTPMPPDGRRDAAPLPPPGDHGIDTG